MPQLAAAASDYYRDRDMAVDDGGGGGSPGKRRRQRQRGGAMSERTGLTNDSKREPRNNIAAQNGNASLFRRSKNQARDTKGEGNRRRGRRGQPQQQQPPPQQ